MAKLGPLNLYTLRLIGMHNRYYKPRQTTVFLEKHGYIERTGQVLPDGEQVEFSITAKGRLALERHGNQ